MSEVAGDVGVQGDVGAVVPEGIDALRAQEPTIEFALSTPELSRPTGKVPEVEPGAAPEPGLVP